MRIYFAGLGGIGIGPLALLARDLGHEVLGSDQQESRYTKLLEKKGIGLSYNCDGEFLQEAHKAQPIDWFVYTAALPDDHPEMHIAKSLNIDHIAKRDELINFFLKESNLKLIAVSGTHGKTTTTAMLIWLFDQLEIPFAHLVGTNLSFAPSGRYQKGAEWLIYEADEFDRNMLRYRPDTALITSLDYDHSDTYPTIEDYKEAFRQFVSHSRLAITWRSVVQSLGLEPSESLAALSDTNDLSAVDLPGEHNRRNAFMAATTVSAMAGDQIPGEKILRILGDYPGAERRFEKLRDNLYTDYAHHPTEIRATLQMAGEIAPEKKVIAIYQPHQNIRQHELIDEYSDCFRDADKLYWLPTYLSREDKKLDVLAPKDLVEKLTVKPETEIADLDDNLVGTIKDHLENDNVVVVMGAGSVDEWVRERFA